MKGARYPNYSILSGYGAAQTRFSFDYQTLVLGAGLIALVLLFFVGSSMYRQQYVTSQPPVTPPSIGSVFSEPEQPQIAQTNPVKKAAKTSQKTKADEVNVGDNSISTSAISEAKPQQMPAAQTQDQALKNPAPTRTVSNPATV